MASKIYLISEDFPNQKVKPDKLQKEIAADPALQSLIQSINGRGNEVSIDFSGELTTEQEEALDTIVAAHTGTATDIKFHESTTLFSEKKDLLDINEWEDLGGVATDPEFFTPNIASIFGRVGCALKTSGAGAEIRVVEDKFGVITDLTTTPIQLPDTGGLWVPFQFNTDASPNAGGAIYRVEGRRSAATLAEVKYVVISMMEWVIT